VETVVYIHGVVGERRRTQSHRTQYQAMHLGLEEYGATLPSFSEAIQVEWGWDTTHAGATRSLGKAQRVIYDRVKAAAPRDRTGLGSLIFAPAVDPVRDLLTLGWSDIIYYVGSAGKERTRNVVWGEVFRHIGADWQTDITLITHSAGTLIAHDFLFWLFSGERDEELQKLDIMPGTDDVAMARQNWRIRRFITLGSPLAPTLVRSGELVDTLAARGSQKISMAPLGLAQRTHSGSDPVWLNVWDRHDVLSYPVAPFYTDGKVMDLYPDHSDSLLGAHDAYFESRSVQRLLAEHWGD
jgi:hypothetical protein